MADISGPDEMIVVQEAGADGIGLRRTEILLAGRVAMPTAEEQRAAYRVVADTMTDRWPFRSLMWSEINSLPARVFCRKNPYRGISCLLTHIEKYLSEITRAPQGC